MVVEWINGIMKTGKVKESDLYADERGGFFLIDIDSPEELLRLIGPILDALSIIAHPIVPMVTLETYSTYSVVCEALAKRVHATLWAALRAHLVFISQ
jgi:hypothetical protein